MCLGALALAKPVGNMLGRNPAWALAPGLGLLLGKGKSRPTNAPAPPTTSQGVTGPAPSYYG